MDRTSIGVRKVLAFALIALIAGGALRAYLVRPGFAQVERPAGAGPAGDKPAADGPPQPPAVELTAKQLQFIKTAPATRHTFQVTKATVGNIGYNEDAQIQVFTPYQGRILEVFVKLDDRVKAGQPLFTIDSADLLQAESTLVQTAGVYDLTTRSLARARKLVPAGGGAQKDLDQAAADQQTAEGNLKAARAALHIFGKDEAEIDRIVAERHIDGTLVVKSPMSGAVTARNGGPGLFVQPGSAPAPLTVADLSTKWMVANYSEAESPALRRGQEVSAQLLALPDRAFHGRVTAVGENIDPATRRFMVRTEVADPDNVLRPGMFANFVVTTGEAIEAVALPLSGVVREGDGTMTAWVTENGRRFTQRVVELGLQQDGLDQIVLGIRPGETVVTDGAVFLNNILEAGPSD